MATTVNLTKNNTIKRGLVGFSWTVLFFGFFVPLIRGDVKWAIIIFILSFFTFGIAMLVFCFVYNKIYTRSLLESGFGPADEYSRQVLIERGLLLQ